MIIYYAHHHGEVAAFEAADETERLDRREDTVFVKSASGDHYPRSRCYCKRDDALRCVLREQEASQTGIRSAIKELHDELRRINAVITSLRSQVTHD